MKQYYFPNEIWTKIYEYDNTYKIQYDKCINEMNKTFLRMTPFINLIYIVWDENLIN